MVLLVCFCPRPDPSVPLQLTGLFQFTVRLASETEARFTSVERIHHYIQVLGPGSLFTGHTGLSLASITVTCTAVVSYCSSPIELFIKMLISW